MSNKSSKAGAQNSVMETLQCSKLFPTIREPGYLAACGVLSLLFIQENLEKVDEYTRLNSVFPQTV